ncbi:MAG: DUF4173 domain-containing protein [Bacteroidota bacterium]
MKTNDYLIAIATLIYSYLFYEQSGGINFFIFSVLLTAFCVFKDRGLLKQRAWIAAAAGNILTGFAVFYYGTGFTIAANIISLLLLAAVSFNPAASLFVSAVNSLYSYLMTIPAMIVQVLVKGKEEDTGKGINLKKILLLILPLLVCFIFFLLYREANPLFEEVTDKINLDFISADFILFTFFGLILLYGFFYQRAAKGLSEADSQNSNQLEFISEEKHQQSFFASMVSIGSEIFTGMALLILLNVLLLSVNGIDLYYLCFKQQLPGHLTLSQYLHDGTNALIVSIVFAIGILLVFFRGRLNFIAESRPLRWLAYVWVVQNIFMILSTANRNWFYISNFGLTHKRLGVYVFLLLCITGLVTSLLKVAQVKSNWFLFRKNSWACYAALIFVSLVNWDATIAAYNLDLAYTKNVKPDTYYLCQLSYTALPVLQHYYEMEQSGNTDTTFFDANLIAVMAFNSRELLHEADYTGWQSGCIIKKQALSRTPHFKKTALNAKSLSNN